MPDPKAVVERLPPPGCFKCGHTRGYHDLQRGCVKKRCGCPTFSGRELRQPEPETPEQIAKRKAAKALPCVYRKKYRCDKATIERGLSCWPCKARPAVAAAMLPLIEENERLKKKVRQLVQM